MISPVLTSPQPVDPAIGQAVLEKLKDSKYFRETFFWIVNRDEQKVGFVQNPAQAKYYAEQTDDDLILKARHLGFSSEIEGDFFFDCMFTENTNAVTMAHTLDDTMVHMNRVKYYRNTMGTKDHPIEVTLDTEKATEMYFPLTNSYYWIGTAGATGFGRGRQITRGHGSEVAHWKDQAVLTAILNARSRKAKFRLETTANGMGEKFHELWYEVEDSAERSPWKQHFFAWWMDPGNVVTVRPGEQFKATPDENRIREKVGEIYSITLTDQQINWWRMERSHQADKTLMSQEHPSWPREAFLSSGRHIFDLSKLDVMEKRVNDPLFVGDLEDDGSEIEPVDNPEGTLTIWKSPREGKRYFIPADIAEGVKDGAFNVAPVFDRSSWEVVAELRLRCDPGDFGRKMCTLGEYYYWALIAPEMNNHGHAAIEAMKNWREGKGYPHILKTTDLWPEETEKLGFPTDERTKEKAISALRNAIEDLSYFENSKVAIAEIRAAVRDVNGKMVSERAQSRTGQEKKRMYLDCIITRMIAMYCLKFITLDETYREAQGETSPMRVSSIVPSRSGWRKPRPESAGATRRGVI